MTVEQFSQMHTSDTEDYELVEGELIPLSSGTPRHASIRDCTGDLLRSYFRRNAIGRAFAEIDCRVAEDGVRRPDLSLYLNERLLLIDLDKIPAPIAPEIAIEVLSPSESAVDVRRKVRDYLRGGSLEVWLLDYANSELQVHTATGIRLIETNGFLETPLLPGFRAAVTDLLAA